MTPAEDQLELAMLAEQLGFDGVVLADDVFFPYVEPGGYLYTADGPPPFPVETPWPDAAVMKGAIASRTTRLRLLTSVFLPPLRHPLLAARAIGTATILAAGRISLGLGVGWMREEFDTLGVPFAERGARIDEAIAAMRKLWQPGPVEYHGRFFSFGPLMMEPAPHDPAPILVGGASEAAMARAVRFGDGFVAPEGPIDRMFGVAQRIRGMVKEAVERLAAEVLEPTRRLGQPDPAGQAHS